MKEQILLQWAPEETEQGQRVATCEITAQLSRCASCKRLPLLRWRQKRCICCNVAICWLLLINAWQQRDEKTACVWHNHTNSFQRKFNHKNTRRFLDSEVWTPRPVVYPPAELCNMTPVGYAICWHRPLWALSLAMLLVVSNKWWKGKQQYHVL